MINKIRAYLDHAFRDVPDTKKSRDLKDELFANLVEKYSDHLAAGKSETDAYNAAIAGIGDISELIDSLRSMGSADVDMGGSEPVQKLQKRAGLIACGVACIIASPIFVIFFSVYGDPIFGVCLLLASVAVGVGLIVYANMTRPKYVRADDSVVEDFKEWRAQSQNQQDAYKSFRSGYWALVVAIYLIISFMTFSWHITWIIFIIAVAAEHVIKGLLQLNDMREERHE